MLYMNLSWKKVTLELRHKFKISRNASDKREIITLKLTDNRGSYGLGEIIHYPYYGQ